MNDEIEGVLSQMREKPYFRFYSVDMLGSCEYLPQELFECYSSTCETYPLDEDDVRFLFLLPVFLGGQQVFLEPPSSQMFHCFPVTHTHAFFATNLTHLLPPLPPPYLQ